MNRIVASSSFAFVLLVAGCGGANPEPAADAVVQTGELAHDPAHHVAAAAPETTQPAADGWIQYGQALSAQAAVASSAVITTPADYVGKVIKVEGAVAQVCQSAGCWLSFVHEGKDLTVNMKDHAFSVDKKGAGSWCEAEGELKQEGESLSLTAHAVRMKPPVVGAPVEPPIGGAPVEAPAPASEG